MLSSNCPCERRPSGEWITATRPTLHEISRLSSDPAATEAAASFAVMGGVLGVWEAVGVPAEMGESEPSVSAAKLVEQLVK